jgi:hypothetical protein
MRYYSAKLGRFLNQDPIEEAGGINLYAFCGNDGVNRFDLLGTDPQDITINGHDYTKNDDGTITRHTDQGDYTFAVNPNGNVDVGYGTSNGYEVDGNVGTVDPQRDPIGDYNLNNTLSDLNASQQDTSQSSFQQSVYFDPNRGRGFEIVRENEGKKLGQINVHSRADARRVLYALGLRYGSADVFRAKLAIYARNDPAGYARNALRLQWLSAVSGLIQVASTPGFRSGVGGGFVAEAVNTTNEGRLVTVIGSMRDIARGGYHVTDGFNTLRVGNFEFMSPEAFDAINRNFMRIAIERGDDFWLVTNPTIHRALSQEYNFQSRFLDLEIPMLEVGRNVTIPTR